MMVSSLRSYWSFNVSNASTKCCLASLDFWRAKVCSSMIARVRRSLRVTCLANAFSSAGNIHRSQGMCSAIDSEAPSFRPLDDMALSSSPCSSITPSAFTKRFPNASRVMLLNATAPKYFLSCNPFVLFSEDGIYQT